MFLVIQTFSEYYYYSTFQKLAILTRTPEICVQTILISEMDRIKSQQSAHQHSQHTPSSSSCGEKPNLHFTTAFHYCTGLEVSGWASLRPDKLTSESTRQVVLVELTVLEALKIELKRPIKGKSKICWLGDGVQPVVVECQGLIAPNPQTPWNLGSAVQRSQQEHNQSCWKRDTNPDWVAQVMVSDDLRKHLVALGSSLKMCLSSTNRWIS